MCMLSTYTTSNWTIITTVNPMVDPGKGRSRLFINNNDECDLGTEVIGNDLKLEVP